MKNTTPNQSENTDSLKNSRHSHKLVIHSFTTEISKNVKNLRFFVNEVLITIIKTDEKYLYLNKQVTIIHVRSGRMQRKLSLDIYALNICIRKAKKRKKRKEKLKITLRSEKRSKIYSSKKTKVK